MNPEVRLRARAKTPKPCCYTVCKQPGTLIFVGGGYKYLACCKEHAEIVAARIPTLEPATRKFFWNK